MAHLVFVLAMLLALLGSGGSERMKPKNITHDDLYCGAQNCYSILSVARKATKREIQKSYRDLSRKYHPDKNKGEDTTLLFQGIAKAYEILVDDATRQDYDYYLEHPDEVLYNKAQWFRTTLPKHTEAAPVVFGFLVALSVVHYLMRLRTHQVAVDHFLRTDKRVQQRARAEALSQMSKRGGSGKSNKGGLSKREREQLAMLENEALKRLAGELDIKGGYAAPGFGDIIIVRLLMLPVTVARHLWWWGDWTLRYNIQNRPYDDDAVGYLTAKALGITVERLQGMEPAEKRDDLLSRELWIKKNYEAYLEEEKQDFKAKRPALYKRIMRHRKRAGGPVSHNYND